MASYNKVIMAGNLTRDPQLSYTPNNTPVCEFALASSRRWRGKDGEQRESTCFVDCRLYGKGAEVFNQYMNKGRGVLIDGRLDFQQWETQEGQKRSKHMVIVENFQFLGSGRGEGSDGGSRGGENYSGDRGGESHGGGRPSESPAPAERPAGPSPANDAPPPPADGDIPF